MVKQACSSLLLLVLFAVSCKARNPSHDGQSEVLAQTTIDKEFLDLTAFSANGPAIAAQELDAFRKYSSDDLTGNGVKYYVRINGALRNSVQADIDYYSGIIKNIASMINKLRGSSCVFYRYLNMPVTVSRQLSRSGQRFIEKGFFSTTTRAVAPKGFELMPHVIIGRSNHCASVAAYSAAPAEQEVLFPPGSEFTVTGDTDGKHFYVEEVEPGTARSPGAAVSSLTASYAPPAVPIPQPATKTSPEDECGRKFSKDTADYLICLLEKIANN